jgi:hypothetical protein
MARNVNIPYMLQIQGFHVGLYLYTKLSTSKEPQILSAASLLLMLKSIMIMVLCASSVSLSGGLVQSSAFSSLLFPLFLCPQEAQSIWSGTQNKHLAKHEIARILLVEESLALRYPGHLQALFKPLHHDKVIQRGGGVTHRHHRQGPSQL